MKTLANKTGKGKRVGIALIFLLMSLLPAMVETGMAAEARLTLAEAVKTALENNHELKALKNSHAAKQADIGIARSYLLPKISLEERYLRTVNPTYAFMTKLNQQRIELTDFAPDSLNHPDAVNDFQTSVSFEQPLFVRKATVGLEMSKMEVEASEETLQRKKEEMAFKVVQNYLMVSTAGGYVKVAEKALEDTREHQRLAEVRYKAGLGLYSDVLRASTAAADAGTEAGQRREESQRGQKGAGADDRIRGGNRCHAGDARFAGKGDRRFTDSITRPERCQVPRTEKRKRQKQYQAG